MKLTLISLAGTAVIAICFSSAGNAGMTSQTATKNFQPQSETFTGVVTREPSDRAPVPYILYDENRMTNFYLDDNSKVAKYDEKEVEITGTLDGAKHTIRVDTVKELK